MNLQGREKTVQSQPKVIFEVIDTNLIVDGVSLPSDYNGIADGELVAIGTHVGGDTWVTEDAADGEHLEHKSFNAALVHIYDEIL
jgi:hypothetical protein